MRVLSGGPDVTFFTVVHIVFDDYCNVSLIKVISSHRVFNQQYFIGSCSLQYPLYCAASSYLRPGNGFPLPRAALLLLLLPPSIPLD